MPSPGGSSQPACQDAIGPEHQRKIERQLTSASTSSGWGSEGYRRQLTVSSDGSLPSPTHDPAEARAAQSVLPPGWQGIPEHFPKVQAPPKVSLDSRVAVLANGTRGDIEPSVALACELQARGHRVIVFTNYDYVGFSNGAGVESVSVYASMQAVLEGLGGIPAVKERSSVADLAWKAMADREIHSAAKAWAKANPSLVQDLNKELEAFRPQLLVATLASAHAARVYESKHGVPAICIHNTTADGAFFLPRVPPRPCLFAVSPLVDVRMPCRDSMDFVTGPWLLQEDHEGIAGEAVVCGLQRFLEAGEPPVTVSWGPMTVRGYAPVDMLGFALEALARAGKRGVVLGGWGKLHELAPKRADLAAYAAASVLFLPHFPHSWLLPRSCCLVHHGGLGTMQAALRAGCPQVVTPVNIDQFSSAKRVTELRAGVGFTTPLPEITAATLAGAIAKAQLTRPSPYLAARLRNERGVETAAELLEAFLHDKASNWSIR